MIAKKRADIKTTYFCNNDCIFCAVGDLKKLGDRSFDDIKKDLLDSKTRCQEVIFTGGEVSIREDFEDLIKLARSIGYETIQIQTNGRKFASLPFCHKIFGNDDKFLSQIQIATSIHGYCARQHDQLTRAPESFNDVIRGVLNLKSLGICVMTNTVIVNQNYRDISKMAKLLVALEVDQFQFAFVHPIGNALKYFDDLVPKISEVMPYVCEGLQIGIDAGKSVLTEGIPYCLMHGYEGCIAENNIPEAEIRGLGCVNIDNFSVVRKNDSKMKFPQCGNCKCDTLCEGPWREYPEKLGNEEFQSIQ